MNIEIDPIFLGLIIGAYTALCVWLGYLWAIQSLRSDERSATAQPKNER